MATTSNTPPRRSAVLARLRRRLDAEALHQLRGVASAQAVEIEELRGRAEFAEDLAEAWQGEAMDLQLSLCRRRAGAPGITRGGALVLVQRRPAAHVFSPARQRIRKFNRWARASQDEFLHEVQMLDDGQELGFVAIGYGWAIGTEYRRERDPLAHRVYRHRRYAVPHVATRSAAVAAALSSAIE